MGKQPNGRNLTATCRREFPAASKGMRSFTHWRIDFRCGSFARCGMGEQPRAGSRRAWEAGERARAFQRQVGSRKSWPNPASWLDGFDLVRRLRLIAMDSDAERPPVVSQRLRGAFLEASAANRYVVPVAADPKVQRKEFDDRHMPIPEDVSAGMFGPWAIRQSGDFCSSGELA